ncbi:MAG: Dabb family protein [Bacteroidales bacterium]|nr:Dabb family protein [Bacteroidales bacterium]
MIRHIVMFRMKEEYSEEDKRKYAFQIKDKLDTLPALISCIKKMEVGVDILRSDRSYDVVLTADFENMEDLNEYTINPHHVEAVQLVRQHRDLIAVVDYLV